METPRSSPVLDFIAVLLAWRRVVVSFAVGALVVSLAYALLAKPTYLARTTLLPKQEEGQFPGLTSLVSNDASTTRSCSVRAMSSYGSTSASRASSCRWKTT